ncbi:MAG: aspartyl protease family protein [Steroidobacteraceae bacterium]|jgi:predicted aspartyl protease|nr:aspartyl protease family protein [Steroidobacteraceae bacterium]
MPGHAFRRVLRLLVALVALPGTAQTAPAPAEPRAPATDGSHETQATTTESPPSWVAPTRIDRVGRILAPVYVNGSGPYAFVVDTGASRSAIAPRLVTALALEDEPGATVTLRGITGTEQVPSIRVRRLEYGHVALDDQLLPVVRPGIFANADGILGVEGLEGSCLHADFLRQTISIDRGKCPRAKPGWLRVPAELRFGQLFTVQGRIGRTRVTIIVDTGAERTLGNRALLEALDLQQHAEDPANRAQVMGATSRSQPGSMIPAPEIRIAGIAVTRTQVTFGEFDVFGLWSLEDQPALLLGMDVVGAADALMIDYRREELRLLPTGSAFAARTGSRVPGSRLR